MEAGIGGMVSPDGSVGPAMMMTASDDDGDDQESFDFVIDEKTGEVIVHLAELEERDKDDPWADPWDYMSPGTRRGMIVLAFMVWIFAIMWITI